MTLAACGLGITAVLAANSAPAAAMRPTARLGEAATAACPQIDSAAAANRLPPAFLARVLWQESRFNSAATSPAGAQGIAQFMPQTASERGLADPRDADAAIAEAARLLADLAAQFGNFGLAAAGYNAGAGRVEKWLNARADLPLETRLYVAAVTGSPVEDWAGRAAASANSRIDRASCFTAMLALAPAFLDRAAATAPPAWQVRLDASLAGAVRLLSSLPRARDIPPRPLRAAEGLCGSLRALGASCAVYQP